MFFNKVSIISNNQFHILFFSSKSFFNHDTKALKGIHENSNNKLATTNSNSYSWKNPKVSHFYRGKQASHTAGSILSYFSKKGNISRIENLFSKSFLKQSITYKLTKKPNPVVYFPAFIYAATPFVRLKTRRRGNRRKRLLQKLTYRPRLSGQRQAFLLFSKSFRSSFKKAKNASFLHTFQSQRETLLVATRRRSPFKKTGSAVSTSITSKSIRDIRDEIHRRAYQIKPRSRAWRRKKTYKKRAQ